MKKLAVECSFVKYVPNVSIWFREECSSSLSWRTYSDSPEVNVSEWYCVITFVEKKIPWILYMELIKNICNKKYRKFLEGNNGEFQILFHQGDILTHFLDLSKRPKEWYKGLSEGHTSLCLDFALWGSIKSIVSIFYLRYVNLILSSIATFLILGVIGRIF